MSKMKQPKYQKKCIFIASLLMCIVVILSFFLNGTTSEAAWVKGEVDSEKYETIKVDGPNGKEQAEAPTFKISKYKSTHTDDVAIITKENQTTVQGVGNFQAGDTFSIGAERPGFKSKNIKYTSSNDKVLKVNPSGDCTVVAPGKASIIWVYTYQRYYVTTESVESSATDESGNATTQTTEVLYVNDQSTISGTLEATFNPQIVADSIHLKPNDTMYLKTNVPESNKTFTADCTHQEKISSLTWKAVNKWWYVVITSKDLSSEDVNGSVFVTVSIIDDNVTLRSNPYELIINNEFTMSPSSTSFNCVTYEKDYNGNYLAKSVNKKFTIETSRTNEKIHWYYIDADADSDNGVSEEIATGSPVTLREGMTAQIGRNSLELTTDENFDFPEGKNSYSFTIKAEQTFGGVTYRASSMVTITRPVKDIQIQQASTGKIYNSQQEMYTKISYTTNANGIAVPEAKFGNDTDILTAYLAGLGDEEVKGGAQGTDGSAIDSYEFMHTPYNSQVDWVSTDPSVVEIQTVTAGTGLSTCNVMAVGAGKATVQAISKDGSFIAAVEYIVRPYPKTVTLKDTTLNLKLGESDSKNVTLTPYVSSGDWKGDPEEARPAADEYLDEGLLWEISSENSTEGGSIAQVDQNGRVTVTAPGTVVVRATSSVSHNGFNGYRPFAVCTIVVEQPVEKISIINKPEEPIMTGDVIALKTKIEPNNATDQTVTWSSANPSIVTVDQSGKVTAVGPGSTTVRVQTNSGAKYDTCTIDVCRLAQSITLNKTEATVSRGKKLTLLATVLPEDTTDKTVTWTSSDKRYATVSNKGVVTGVKVSKDPIIITATTSNGKSASCYVTVTEPVTGIKISPKKKTVYVGNTFTIKKILYPLGNDSINRNVTWKSSNKKVATVDKNGKVTPKAGGKCTITCTSEDGGYVAKCIVTVKEKVRSIKLNAKKLSLVIGKSYQLKATVSRKTATNRAVLWKSSNPKVVQVSSTGKIKALKKGKATITCMAKDKSGVKAVCKVSVVRKCASLTLNKSYITLITGYQYKTLKAVVRPKSATNKRLLWTSSDKSIVTVNKRTGTMFAESAGTAFVTVKTTDGTRLSRRCRVKVIDPVPITTLEITKSSITIVKGHKNQLETRVIPQDTTSSVKWMTDDRSVATVSSNGLVKAVGVGTTTITAYCNDGIESQCTVEVIQMNPTSIAIEQYDNYTLTVDGASETNNITWTSSNANIVTVTGGRVMGVKPGVAIVTATYNGKKVRCRVTVKNIS